MFTSGGQIDLLTFTGVHGGGGKGGGGGTPQYVPPSYTDPVSGATFLSPDELNTEITQRKAQEAQTTQAATDKATADAATAEQTFQTNRTQAYNDALAATQRTFQLQGVDPSQYMSSDITPALQRQYNSIQDLDPNPAAAFPLSLGNDIITNLLSGKRTQATNQLNQVFDPNYAQNLLPDTTADPFVSQIVSEQFDPLTTQLSNAQKRHTLTDQGYQAALDALTQKRTAATDTVTNLGRGILASDRSDIGGLVSGAKTAASGLGLSDTFDPSTYTGQTQSRAQSDISNFGGALRNAVGGTQFATLQDLINAGGAVQGSQNPTAANPTGSVAGTSPSFVPQDVLDAQKRGLGNTGAF